MTLSADLDPDGEFPAVARHGSKVPDAFLPSAASRPLSGGGFFHDEVPQDIDTFSNLAVVGKSLARGGTRCGQRMACTASSAPVACKDT